MTWKKFVLLYIGCRIGEFILFHPTTLFVLLWLFALVVVACVLSPAIANRVEKLIDKYVISRLKVWESNLLSKYLKNDKEI